MPKRVAQVVESVATELAALPHAGTAVINVRCALRDALRADGQPELRAEELAEDWVGRLAEKLDARMAEWDALGLPRPVVAVGGDTLLTYHHEWHPEAAGLALPGGLSELYELLGTVTPREMLLVTGCLLYLCGCRQIIVTEGSDGGVDVMGRVAAGPLRSLCVFAQAKTSGSPIPKQLMLVEHGKFRDLRRNSARMWVDYLAALGTTPSADGQAYCYVVVANAEYEPPARRYASDEHVLLRSRRQIAFWLAERCRPAAIRALIGTYGGTMYRDLNRNVATLIAPAFA